METLSDNKALQEAADFQKTQRGAGEERTLL
jgi:hypothetical protein